MTPSFYKRADAQSPSAALKPGSAGVSGYSLPSATFLTEVPMLPRQVRCGVPQCGAGAGEMGGASVCCTDGLQPVCA